MQLLTSLLVLIITARLMGHLFARYNQPAVVGEMLAGVVLGPAVLGFIEPSAALSGISALAVFLVVLAAGLEMDLASVVRAMKGSGLVIAALGFVLPFGSGLLIAEIFGLDAMRMIFLGLCIAITALPVAVKILADLNLLETPIARYAIATAILNDLLALFILGVVLALPAESGISELLASGALAAVKLAGLLLLVLGVNTLIVFAERRGINITLLPERVVKTFGAEALFGAVVVFVLFFGMVSETLGFHVIIGAFFGALLLDKRHFTAQRYEELRHTLAAVTAGFLAPIFFADLGLEFRFPPLDEIGFVMSVLLVSIASKVFAGWLGGRLAGMTHSQALALGAILNGRGVMELVVAGIAFDRGFIGPLMFSALVLMGVVTTLLSPILLNIAMPADARKAYAQLRHDQ